MYDEGVKDAPGRSGVYLSDVDRIVRRALESIGVGPSAEVLLEAAMESAGVTLLPREAEALWGLCSTHLVPQVQARFGAVAAERFAAAVHGALVALDAIQHNRGPAFTRT